MELHLALSFFKLVLKLRLLELTQSAKIHLVHIAGSKMISQGTEGLSRVQSFERSYVWKDTFYHFFLYHLQLTDTQIHF